jgi:hypothetical protein
MAAQGGVMKLRCSELDRVMACPASAYPQPGETQIDHESGDAAKVGTAVHAVMADVVRQGWRTVPDVRPYCEDAGCSDSETDVRILSYAGMKFLNEYRAFLSDSPFVEGSFAIDAPWGKLTGHADILDYVEAGGERIVYVIDWKTGDKTEDDRYRYQMLGYGALGLNAYADRAVDKVKVIVAWLRAQEATVRTYRASDVEQFIDMDLPRALNWDGQTYTPGDACRYCHRVAACPGRRDLMLAAVEVLTSERRGELIPWNGQLVDPGGFARSILQARFLRDLCDEHLRQGAQAVKAMGVTDIPTPSGQHIKLVSRAGSPKLKPERVLPYLRDRFGEIPDEDLYGMVKLSKSSVDSFVASKGERGEKKALKEAVFAELEQTGAMTRGEPVEFLEIKEG